mmetsp:Transcript_751/g.1100  ORF Transcript_751/g.1100 Transcript_751/m.1100 type:complete len:1238 (-) Transcript_751:661-4374(-)
MKGFIHNKSLRSSPSEEGETSDASKLTGGLFLNQHSGTLGEDVVVIDSKDAKGSDSTLGSSDGGGSREFSDSSTNLSPSMMPSKSLWTWAFGGTSIVSPRESARDSGNSTANDAASSKNSSKRSPTVREGKEFKKKTRGHRRKTSGAFEVRTYLPIDQLRAEDYKVNRARDPKSLKLGSKWFALSGGLQKKTASSRAGISYHTYLSPGALAKDSRDRIQIEKDIERTCLSEDVHPGLHAYFSDTLWTSEEEVIENGSQKGSVQGQNETKHFSPATFDVSKELRRVLCAAVVRNPHLGYTQGMNYLGCMFLGLMQEEDAFWTLCAVIEDLRTPDYFSASPRTLGGYHLDAHILDGVVQEVFSELKPQEGETKDSAEFLGALDDLQGLAQALSLFYPRWLLPLFYSELRLDTMIALWDAFFVINPTISAESVPATPVSFKSPLSQPSAMSWERLMISPRSQLRLRAGAGESALMSAVLTIVEKALAKFQQMNESKEASEGPFALFRDVCKSLSPEDLIHGFVTYLPRVSPPLLRRRRRRIISTRARASNASPWGTPVLSDITGFKRDTVDVYQRGFWGWSEAQQGKGVSQALNLKKKAGYGEFRTHLSVQEEGLWMEVTGNQKVPILRGPKLSFPRARIPGNQEPYLPPGSRIRILKKQGHWIKHVNGWSPGRNLKDIPAPAQGLELEAFTALAESCGVERRRCLNLFHQADVDGNGFVDFPEVLYSLSSLRHEADPHLQAKSLFLLYCENKSGLLDERAANALAKDLVLPRHLCSLMSERLKEGHGFMSLHSFESLLETPHSFEFHVRETPVHPASTTATRDSGDIKQANDIGGVNISAKVKDGADAKAPLANVMEEDEEKLRYYERLGDGGGVEGRRGDEELGGEDGEGYNDDDDNDEDCGGRGRLVVATKANFDLQQQLREHGYGRPTLQIKSESSLDSIQPHHGSPVIAASWKDDALLPKASKSNGRKSMTSGCASGIEAAPFLDTPTNASSSSFQHRLHQRQCSAPSDASVRSSSVGSNFPPQPITASMLASASNPKPDKTKESVRFGRIYSEPDSEKNNSRNGSGSSGEIGNDSEDNRESARRQLSSSASVMSKKRPGDSYSAQIAATTAAVTTTNTKRKTSLEISSSSSPLPGGAKDGGAGDEEQVKQLSALEVKKNRMREYLRPLSISLDPLLPIWETDPEKGGGGRAMKVKLFSPPLSLPPLCLSPSLSLSLSPLLIWMELSTVSMIELR